MNKENWYYVHTKYNSLSNYSLCWHLSNFHLTTDSELIGLRTTLVTERGVCYTVVVTQFWFITSQWWWRTGESQPYRDSNAHAGESPSYRNSNANAGESPSYRDSNAHAGESPSYRDSNAHAGEPPSYRNSNANAGESVQYGGGHLMVSHHSRLVGNRLWVITIEWWWLISESPP